MISFLISTGHGSQIEKYGIRQIRRYFHYALLIRQFQDNVMISKMAPMLSLAMWGDSTSFESAMRSLNKIKLEKKIDPVNNITKAAVELEGMRQKEIEVFGPTSKKKRIHIKESIGNPLAGVKIKGGTLTNRTSNNS